MGPGDDFPLLYDLYQPRASYSNTGKPIFIKEDKLVGTTFNAMVDSYLKGRPTWVPSNSILPLWEQKEQKIATQVIGYDECGQPYGVYLYGNVVASQYVSNQPGTFLAILLRRLLESGVDVGPENEQRFNEFLSSIGIGCASDMLRYTQAGVLPTKAQVDAIVWQVTEELRDWLAAELHEPSEAGKLNLFKILDKTHSLLSESFAGQMFSPDAAEDKKIKKRSLERLRHHIDSVLLIASTDGTWKTKLWMSVGNARLGAQMAEKASDRLGVNYAWTNLDPYALDPNVLIQRLQWWADNVGVVAGNNDLIDFGMNELFKTAARRDIGEWKKSISPADPAQKTALVRAVENKINDIINEIANPATREEGRKHLADYLVSLSNNLTSSEKFENSRELLLSHVALGSLARIVMLGSLLPQVLTCRYETDQARTVMKQNPFSGRTEIETVLLIRGGPDPSDKIESAVFTDWLGNWMKSAHAGIFEVGRVSYNKATGAYEMRFKAEVESDWKAYSSTRLQIHVPAYLYDFSPADLGAREGGVAVPESQLVWEWTGSADPFISPPKTKTTITQWSRTDYLQVPKTTTEYPLNVRVNLPFYFDAHPTYGGPVGFPYLWWSDLSKDRYHRETDTKYMFRDLGYAFGSPTLYEKPLISSYLLERLPHFGLIDEFLKMRPGWTPLPGSAKAVSKQADVDFDEATRIFLLSGRPDLAGLKGPFSYDPLAQPDYSSISLSLFSMPLHEAWRAYWHIGANRYASSNTTDSAMLAALRRDTGKWAQYGGLAMLYEFFPGPSVWKGLGIASDFSGKNAFNALREQEFLVGEWKQNEHIVELFLGYHPGGEIRTGEHGAGRTSMPLVIPLSVFDAKFSGVYVAAAHYAWTHKLSEHWSTQVNFGIGGLFDDGGMRAEIGTYERGDYRFAFKEHSIPVLPLFDCRGQISYNAPLGELSYVSSTLTIQPSFWHYYQAAKGLYWMASGFKNLDNKLADLGLDYAKLYTPDSFPINDAPLASVQEVENEFRSRGISLDSAGAQTLRRLGNDALVNSENGSGLYHVKKNKDNTYSIYNEYDFTNPAFGSKLPLTRHSLEFMTKIPLRSIGKLQASLSQRWNINAWEIECMSLGFLLVPEDARYPSVQFGLDYLNPARRPVYQFSAKADYKPVDTVLGDFFAGVGVHAYFKDIWFPTDKGGHVISGGLTFSIDLAVPVKRETIDTYEFGSSGTSTTYIDCNGLTTFTRAYNLWKTSKTQGP